MRYASYGIQVLIGSPDQEALFARICGFFERTAYDIVDAKIYTTSHGYALARIFHECCE